jgi:uncharacterized YigZ family protein
MEQIKTLAAPTHRKLRVKDSRFYADAAPAQSREEAEKFVDSIRQRFPDATHHCFAYRVGVGDQAVTRSGDAGEPGGTAGRPILQAIEARGLANVVLVVTRYFGGTKLGTGGLIRAYSAAAFAVLDAATVVTRAAMRAIDVEIHYEHLGAVQHLVARLNGVIMDEGYGEKVRLRISVPRTNVENLIEDLRNLTSGRVNIEVVESDPPDE